MRVIKGNWPEARLVPHVAGLLLREVLGMKVEYVKDGGKEVNASRMYDMLAKEEADLALTLWPAKFFYADRKEALDRMCSGSSTKRCMTIVGNQGYQARSGWFVNVNAVEEEVAEWSTVLNLYNQKANDRLIKARPPHFPTLNPATQAAFVRRPYSNRNVRQHPGARSPRREHVRVGGIAGAGRRLLQLFRRQLVCQELQML